MLDSIIYEKARTFNAGRIECLTTHYLRSGDETEVLSFLSKRPLHTIVMAGLIRDNGIESQRNRGDFYACRNAIGEIEGVALLGHAMFIETKSDEALSVFARLARGHKVHLMLGEQNRISRFWNYYAPQGQQVRRLCREQMLTMKRSATGYETKVKPRLATIDDLPHIAPVHAQMAFEESGVNPLEKDPNGFRERCARRVKRKRVWVLVRDERLIFKTDVIAETEKVTYLEGVYVHPEERGKGIGSACFVALSRILLERTETICVLVNEQNLASQAFFQKVGCEFDSYYDTIFLQ
jgi:hypothetical protein